MKNVLKNIIENKWTHYIVITIIGLLISVPMLNMQIVETHDGSIHLLRIIGLNISMENSEFPFLLIPYYCRNFGYSMSAIYPQIVTYIPFLLGILTKSFNLGLKLFTMLTIPISGICMYNFTKEITKRKEISFLSAIIYMTIPYRFEDIFTRFAIGEFTAFIFLPIVFQGLYNLINGDTPTAQSDLCSRSHTLSASRSVPHSDRCEAPGSPLIQIPSENSLMHRPVRPCPAPCHSMHSTPSNAPCTGQPGYLSSEALPDTP